MIIKRITNTGVDKDVLSLKFNDKVATRNKFSLLCSFFSTLYLCYFIGLRQPLPFFLLLAGILLFTGSIVLNAYRKYHLSSVLILISTNYCVLFTSLFFGFACGFHLYLLISPLIVFILFSKEDKLFFRIAICSYAFTFVVVTIAGKIFDYKLIQLSQQENALFYSVNFLFALILLVVLLLYFSYNNSRINAEIEMKNAELIKHEQELYHENQIRKETEVKLLRVVKEKDILLSEVHHRVKNNLAVISAFLELENNSAAKTIDKCVLKINQNRIKAIALLHELLYKSEALERVDMKKYLYNLTKYLQLNFSGTGIKSDFHIKCDSFSLKFNRGMSLGLILNELISNSFRDLKRQNELNIHIYVEQSPNQIILYYKDGFSDFAPKKSEIKSSCSLDLIGLLISQLEAEYEIINKNGKIFKLQFKSEL